ncbi:MAG TPA: glycosyltransferase [Telluria sp.]|nr:glycosyltransferase [Telluria sp.]
MLTSSLPLVSVVMPSFNQPDYIDAAITAVLGQDYPHVELFVADGGSGSATTDILSARSAADSRLRYFSRPDRGPAHALNDAMSMVRGTVIGWLNSDDLYTDGAISRAATALAANPHHLMVYGHGEHTDANGTPTERYPTLPPSTPIAKFAEGCFICQPTMFFRRTARLMLGNLDEQLKAAFDFDYWMRAFSLFPDRIGFVDKVQAYSRLHGDCITMRMRRTVALEGMQVIARYLGTAPKEWILTYLNETLKLDSSDRGIADMREHMRQTIDAASPWMTHTEKSHLEAAVARQLNGK